MRVWLTIVAATALLPVMAQQVQVTAVRQLPAGVVIDAPADSTVWVEGRRVHVVVDGAERVFSPVESRAGYLWPAVSPDRRRVAFYAAGRGIVIIDLRGQLLAMPGDYEMPCWYDNDHLVAREAAYDGLRLATSRIVLLKADGSWHEALTAPSASMLSPCCRDGRVLYTDSADGTCHEITLTIYDE